jgi:dTDP-4-dehydrorhamnose 3,5-epimerase
MIFTETKLKGAYIIEPERLEDNRGFFARAWCKNEFDDHGLNPHFVQINLSFNKSRGTIRGLHYQTRPNEEAKLIRCIRGAIYDVIIDLRPNSPTYLEWIGEELTADNRKMLYVPENFAHGYQSLKDNTEVFYPVSQFYSPESVKGLRWNDPTFGIKWPEADNLIISEQDKKWPDYSPVKKP